jgi:hypothetical protein
MNYSEIDWSRGQNRPTAIDLQSQKIKELALACVDTGLTIRQSVDLIIRVMS